MGRAFREGIAPEKRVRFKHKITRMVGLGSRAKVSKIGEGPRTRVPAMITIEDDEWIWKPALFSPDTPDVLPIWPELFEWSPLELNDTSEQVAHYAESSKKNARDMPD